MIYISNVMPEEDLKLFCARYHTGIESIEFGIGDSLDSLENTLGSYKQKAKHFLEHSFTLHGPFLDLNPVSADTLIRKASRQRFEEAYTAARQLKAAKIIYHSCFMPCTCFLECWIDDSIHFWKDFIEKNGTDIPICIENVWDTDFAPLREVVEAVDHPAFSFCLDIGHAHAFSKYSVVEWIKGMNHTIGHVHLHDNDCTRDSHLALGNGSIPVKEALSLFYQMNPALDYTIENNNFNDAVQSFNLLSSIYHQSKES